MQHQVYLRCARRRRAGGCRLFDVLECEIEEKNAQILSLLTPVRNALNNITKKQEEEFKNKLAFKNEMLNNDPFFLVLDLNIAANNIKDGRETRNYHVYGNIPNMQLIDEDNPQSSPFKYITQEELEKLKVTQ